MPAAKGLNSDVKKTSKLVDLTDNLIRFFLYALFSFPKDPSATIYNLATV